MNWNELATDVCILYCDFFVLPKFATFQMIQCLKEIFWLVKRNVLYTTEYGRITGTWTLIHNKILLTAIVILKTCLDH